jgi:hypothetical protein
VGDGIHHRLLYFSRHRRLSCQWMPHRGQRWPMA